MKLDWVAGVTGVVVQVGVYASTHLLGVAVAAGFISCMLVGLLQCILEAVKEKH